MPEGTIVAGRTAVITGAGSGIGRAMARRLAGHGCPVALCDWDEDGLHETAETIGGPTLARKLDVRDRGAQMAFAAEVREWAPAPLGMVFNNAGVTVSQTAAEAAVEDDQWVVDVNFWGVVHGLHTFVPLMREQGTPGHVVNTASIGGLLSGTAFIGPYCATKAAAVSMSESLVQELAVDQTPIGVSVLCPSSVNTNVMESERNRPAAAGVEQRTEMAESVRLMIRDGFTGPTGQTPAQVAERVLDAVRHGEFWIITHDDLRPTVEARVTGMLAAFPGGGG
jgi:NAD(P)-dependent dehydrogenase (short-subunit alcohol dehydrogenase family)